MSLLPAEKEKRQVYVLREAKTDDKFGHYPDSRPIDTLLKYGVINLDKPSGPTSHQVSFFVSQILGVKKAGHSGTLDPKVTGVLPIILNKATGMANLMLKSGKEYVTLMHLHCDVDDRSLTKVCSEFVGTITQMPPVKSAVKRRYRKRTVYYLEILDRKGRDVLIKTGVQAGTYIRKLVHDIGQKLGCGAHMVELRRTKSGPFTEYEKDHLVTLQDLKDAVYYYKEEGNERFLRYCIQPFEKTAEFVPKVYVLDSAIDPIAHGSPLNLPGISKIESGIKKGSVVAVVSLKGELVAYGTAEMSTQEMLSNKRGLAIKIDRVFIEPGIYPKYVKNPSNS